MISRIFHSRAKTVTFAASLVGFSFLLSRLLGLLRDRLLAGRFGAGPELDIYFAAFRIPDFIYCILVMGGISAVFLPVFSDYFNKDQKEGWKLASNVLNCFLLLLILFCGVMALFTPFLLRLVVPGFSKEQMDLAVVLTRIMFLSPIFFGISSVFSGILHYFDRFLAYSLAPVMYNIGIILGIIFLEPLFGLKGLAFGVVIGAFSHWLIQLPAAKKAGFKYFPSFDFFSPGLRKIFRLMGPRVLGTAGYHLNLIVITAIASTLAAGSVAVFNFANNLQYIPIGLVGTSFAVASFPALSRAWANGTKDRFRQDFTSAFKQIFFLVAPLSVLIFLLRAHLVRLVLGTGQFGWTDTRLTAASLGVFCFGIFAAALVPFLARTFYSFQNTKTPVLISLASVALNVSLSFLFVRLLSFENSFYRFFSSFLKLQGIDNFAVVGLPLAVSVSIVFQFFLLLYFLRKEIGGEKLVEIWHSCRKVLLALIPSAASAYLVLRATAPYLCTDTFLGVFLQAALSFLMGILVFCLSARFLKSSEMDIICRSLFKRN